MAQQDRNPHLFATDWYEDITPQIEENARALGPGGVTLAPNTKMFDALPAFQIGTSKVDTGSPLEFKPLEDELISAVSSFPLDSDRSCAILMDRLVQAEMAWHQGNSLLQTLVSCVGVEHELKQLTNAKMSIPKAFDLNQQESSVVTEYFAQHQQPSSASNPSEYLIKVFYWSLIKAAGTAIELSENHGSTVVFPEEDFHQIRYNLYFLDDTPLQQIVESLEQARKYASQIGFKLVAERLALRVSWLTVLKQRIPRKLANLDRLEQQIENWQPIDDAECGKCDSWFSTGCQSRLDMACVRQPLVTPNGAEAKKFCLRFVGAIRAFVPVFSCTKSVDLLGFYLAFSSRREPAIVRAMAKSLATDTQIMSQSAKQWTLMDINETSPPPGFKQNNKAVETFLNQACWCYTDLITVFCQNRCRMREGLNALIVSFDSLQVSADQLDQILGSDVNLVAQDGSKVPAMYFSSWTYFRKLQVMLWSVLLSFETEILNYSEIAYTNWYASKMCTNLLNHMGRMRLAFEQHGNNARESPGYSYLVALELESQMLLQLTTAQYMLWIALHKLRPPQENPNVSREMQYRLRFQSFETVGVPEMLRFDEFKELSDNLDVTTALQAAGNATQSVRKMLSTLTRLAADNIEIPLLQRSAVGISIAVATVVKLGHEPIKADLDTNGFHWYFPVAKVQKLA